MSLDGLREGGKGCAWKDEERRRVGTYPVAVHPVVTAACNLQVIGDHRSIQRATMHQMILPSVHLHPPTRSFSHSVHARANEMRGGRESGREGKANNRSTNLLVKPSNNSYKAMSPECAH